MPAGSLDPPVLGDGRVRLRLLREEDAAPYAAAFREDPELGRLAGFETDPDEPWVLQRVPAVARDAARGTWVQLTILAAEGGFLGDVALHHIDWRSEKAEVGFWLAPEARGAGHASAAVRLVLRWVFAETPLHRIELRALPENAGALGVARRLGFTREGLLRDGAIGRGVRVSLELWSMLATDEAAGRL